MPHKKREGFTTIEVQLHTDVLAWLRQRAKDHLRPGDRVGLTDELHRCLLLAKNILEATPKAKDPASSATTNTDRATPVARKVHKRAPTKQAKGNGKGKGTGKGRRA